MHDLPIVLDPARLDEGDGIEETLRRNKAPYHQSCRLMFSNTMLERARKRTSDAQNANDVQGCTKLRRTSQELRDSHCFLCGEKEPVSGLRQVITMHLNQRLNDCAQKLNDGKLLAELSLGRCHCTGAQVPHCMFGGIVQQRKTLPQKHSKPRTGPDNGTWRLPASIFWTDHLHSGDEINLWWSCCLPACRYSSPL